MFFTDQLYHYFEDGEETQRAEVPMPAPDMVPAFPRGSPTFPGPGPGMPDQPPAFPEPPLPQRSPARPEPHQGNKRIDEPRCEKTGLRGFRPGQTQSGLCSHRR